MCAQSVFRLFLLVSSLTLVVSCQENNEPAPHHPIIGQWWFIDGLQSDVLTDREDLPPCQQDDLFVLEPNGDWIDDQRGTFCGNDSANMVGSWLVDSEAGQLRLTMQEHTEIFDYSVGNDTLNISLKYRVYGNVIDSIHPMEGWSGRYVRVQ